MTWCVNSHFHQDHTDQSSNSWSSRCRSSTMHPQRILTRHRALLVTSNGSSANRCSILSVGWHAPPMISLDICSLWTAMGPAPLPGTCAHRQCTHIFSNTILTHETNQFFPLKVMYLQCAQVNPSSHKTQMGLYHCRTAMGDWWMGHTWKVQQHYCVWPIYKFSNQLPG
jgi:hypothetical protein